MSEPVSEQIRDDEDVELDVDEGVVEGEEFDEADEKDFASASEEFFEGDEDDEGRPGRGARRGRGPAEAGTTSGEAAEAGTTSGEAAGDGTASGEAAEAGTAGGGKGPAEAGTTSGEQGGDVLAAVAAADGAGVLTALLGDGTMFDDPDREDGKPQAVVAQLAKELPQVFGPLAAVTKKLSGIIEQQRAQIESLARREFVRDMGEALASAFPEHRDAAAVLRDAAFGAWAAKQPKALQAVIASIGIEDVDEAAEILSRFKRDTGRNRERATPRKAGAGSAASAASAARMIPRSGQRRASVAADEDEGVDEAAEFAAAAKRFGDR